MMQVHIHHTHPNGALLVRVKLSTDIFVDFELLQSELLQSEFNCVIGGGALYALPASGDDDFDEGDAEYLAYVEQPDDGLAQAIRFAWWWQHYPEAEYVGHLPGRAP